MKSCVYSVIRQAFCNAGRVRVGDHNHECIKSMESASAAGIDSALCRVQTGFHDSLGQYGELFV